MRSPEDNSNAAPMQSPPPEAHAIQSPDGELTLELSGSWLDYGRCPAWRTLLPKETPRRIIFKDAGITSWNTTLVTFVFYIVGACRADGGECDWSSLPKGVDTLLKLAFAVPEKHIGANTAKESLLATIGSAFVKQCVGAMSIMDFVGQMTVAFVRLFTGHSRTKLSDILFQTARCGHQAISIVSLITMLIGVILGFIGSIPLKMFGAEIFVATLVGLGMLRMMSATTVGTVMAGRTGAAFAAELGAMQSNEEIDAFKAMGLSPFELLVIPRVLALSITMPLLCIYGDLLGVIGGIIVGVVYSGIGFSSYVQHLCATTTLHDFTVGIITSWIFGVLIGVCGCYHGMHCARSSTAVGQAATGAVVSSIVCMVISTALITVITVIIGY